MVLRIICGILVILAAGAFALFVVASLREINSKIDSIPKHHWGMGVYMDDIPQNEQNTSRLVSVPLKIYDKSEYSDILVPRKGAEIFGVYDNGQNRFERTGIVKSVFYNTDMDLIIVECKCIDIRKK